tara:strand:+ start:786 stop:998 length:213 start_codon:yes stop_codon:yes gene_type:complete
MNIGLMTLTEHRLHKKKGENILDRHIQELTTELTKLNESQLAQVAIMILTMRLTDKEIQEVLKEIDFYEG